MGTGRRCGNPRRPWCFVGRRGASSGPAAEVCCDTLNFFTSLASAHTWIKQHSNVTGQVVDRTRAEEIGRTIFGPLLTAD
ncbi:organomercurial lyase [Streptomyces sp. NPDC096354]|uniref:organomercurial lyase n=1 Tax=Streptomyces sp. NPDC096354 TaxID=3366088 RepID=UPI00380B2B8A